MQPQECSLLLEKMDVHNYVIIGAGPSLYYSKNIIQKLIREDSIFLLSDSIAFYFISQFYPKKYVVFTVETRYHAYLKLLFHSEICIYEKANFYNLPRSNQNIFYFHYPQTNNPQSTVMLLSIGTVVGTILAWALYSFKYYIPKKKNIYFIGVDLCFLDQQMYSTYLLANLNSHRFFSQENMNYYITLKKMSSFFTLQGYVIKTSYEFIQTQKNIIHIIKETKDKFKQSIFFKETSPVGLNHPYVEKIVPTEFNENFLNVN